MRSMRPRGESISSPQETQVGHAGRQKPQWTQSSRGAACARAAGRGAAADIRCLPRTGRERAAASGSRRSLTLSSSRSRRAAAPRPSTRSRTRVGRFLEDQRASAGGASSARADATAAATRRSSAALPETKPSPSVGYQTKPALSSAPKERRDSVSAASVSNADGSAATFARKRAGRAQRVVPRPEGLGAAASSASQAAPRLAPRRSRRAARPVRRRPLPNPSKRTPTSKRRRPRQSATTDGRLELRLAHAPPRAARTLARALRPGEKSVTLLLGQRVQPERRGRDQARACRASRPSASAGRSRRRS